MSKAYGGLKCSLDGIMLGRLIKIMNCKVSSYFCNCLRCSRLPNSEENLLHGAENAQPMKDFPDLAEAPPQTPFSLMLFGLEKSGMYLKGTLVAIYAQTASNSFKH